MNHSPLLRRRVLTSTAIAGIGVLCVAGAPAAFADAPTVSPSAALLAPYYTELDLTGDGQVTTADLDTAAAALGATTSDADWYAVSVIDLDHDGEITIVDLAGLSQRMIYDDGPFTLVEASTLDMQAAMNAGVTTSVAITQAYIDRIAAYDRTAQTGATRPLNSIITVSDVALEAAAAADAERAEHGMTSMLLGVPVALKDNYDTADMVTTGGCGCWNGNQTSTDAFMVKGLRGAGAVILAKASLDEFAYGFVSEFSSFQTPGSSLLVASPYDTSKSAGGSSGGTGAAIAANLAGVGFGTDTGGSIRVPSSYNQLVGIRPTVGLTSRDGIIPLALSQDTGGPIARSVLDAAVALDAVVGADPADPVTAHQAGLVPDSYTSHLSDTALQGARIGYIPSMVGTDSATAGQFDKAKATPVERGATVVELTAPTGFSSVLGEGSGSTNEFLHDLNGYIATHLSPAVEQRSLQQIIDGGTFVPSRKSTYAQRNAVTDGTYQSWAGPEGSHTRQLAAGKALVTKLMNDNDLDAIIYPSTNAYGTIGTNMRLSPNTGMPAVTLPMGTTGSGQGGSRVGVNLEWLGRDFDEAALLGLAYDFEHATHYRTTPLLYPALTD